MKRFNKLDRYNKIIFKHAINNRRFRPIEIIIDQEIRVYERFDQLRYKNYTKEEVEYLLDRAQIYVNDKIRSFII